MEENSTESATGEVLSNADLGAILIRMEATMNEWLVELTERVGKLSPTVDNNVVKISELEEISVDHNASIKDLIESATFTFEDLCQIREDTVPAIRDSIKELCGDIHEQLLERDPRQEI